MIPVDAVRVPSVPEYSIVDALDAGLTSKQRCELLDLLGPIHERYFPSYPHVLRELREQAVTGDNPPGERVHAWLVYRDGEAVGEWVMNVNREAGVIMMLFGAIHREARIDLDRGYLLRLVDFMLECVIEQAHAAGEVIHAVILESDAGHLARWHEAGFFTADAAYREPIHGRGWADHGEPGFFDAYSACVRPIDVGLPEDRSALARRALQVLLVDHYGLPVDHPQVIRSLAAAELQGG